VKFIPTSLLRLAAIALCLASAIFLAGCNRGRGRVLEIAYVSGVQAILNDVIKPRTAYVAARPEHLGAIGTIYRVESGPPMQRMWVDAEQFRPFPADVQRMLPVEIGELNRLYRANPALYEVDFHYSGFEWVDFHDGQNSIIAFLRRGRDPKDFILICCNFTPVPRQGYEFGVPEEGFYQEILNTDSELFGGTNMGNGGCVSSRPIPKHQRPHSIAITLPPLAVVAFKKL